MRNSSLIWMSGIANLGLKSRIYYPQAPSQPAAISNGVKLTLRLNTAVPHAPQASVAKGTAKTK